MDGATSQRGGRDGLDSGSRYYLVRVCLVATLGGLLFGYDTAVISGAIGFLSERFELTAAMKGWAASSALAGCVLGAAFAGVLSDWLGRRRLLLVAAVLFTVSALGTALPRNLTEFVVFRLIGGVGVGAAAMASPLYIAEISPARIRGRMVSLNQFAIILGMLVVYFVNYIVVGLGDQAWNVAVGWRWMFGSETLPAVALFVLLFTVPESPRWLVRRGRRTEAYEVLARVNGAAAANQELESVSVTLANEPAGRWRWAAPHLRGVLLIGVVLAVLQQITGINVFLYYAPEIFKGIAGTNMDVALLQTVVVGAVNLAFTVLAIWTVDLLGRKPLMIAGYAGMGACLIGLGGAAYAGRTDAWVLIFVLGYIASFALSVGPVTWVILSEIFPMHVRGSAMAVATFCLWVANFVISQTFPMMDENVRLIRWFGHAFPFWLYAVFCAAAVVFIWRWVPETKQRTLEEIETWWRAEARSHGPAFPIESAESPR